jgi:hypothetical protein
MSGFTLGQKEWTKANIDAGTADPIIDLKVAVQTVNRFSGKAKAIILQPSASRAFEYAINTNPIYKDTANLLVASVIANPRMTIPVVSTVSGLTFLRWWQYGSTPDAVVPIYMYTGAYDVNSGSLGSNGIIQNTFIDDGFMIVLPEVEFTNKFGLIPHMATNFAPMPLFEWISVDLRTLQQERSLWYNYMFDHPAPNQLVSWKVSDGFE